MKISNLLIFGLMSFSLASLADPIVDNAFIGVKAGWISSAGQSCRIVCAKKNTVIEHERFLAPKYKNSHAFACKGFYKDRKSKGQLYGTNFSSIKLRRYCMVPTLKGKVAPLKKFKCLCVRK